MGIKTREQITLSSITDIKTTCKYYLLQDRSLNAPAKPDTYPPMSKWDVVEPSYMIGSANSLYTVDCTVFSDDTFIYSEVSLSSSYEAAKLACDTATEAKNEVTNLEIGAKNLIRNSRNLIFTDYYFKEALTVVDDRNGNITLIYSLLSTEDDGEGNVVINGVSATHDDNGNVVIT